MKRILLTLTLLAGLLLGVAPVLSQTPTPTPTPSNLSEVQQKIKDLENKVAELRGQARTLSSQITVMDNQVRLTQLRIDKARQDLEELEEDIGTLRGKIENLEGDLDKLTKVLLNRIIATYTVSTVKPWQFFISAKSFSDLLYRIEYLRIAQENDKRLIFATQATKDNYEDQKKVLEEKQQQVEALNRQLENLIAQLAQQKKDKEVLLEVTRNDEKKYQELLARARAEFAVSLGQGQETFMREVKEGDIIGRVIPSASGCSSGQHLHFEVHKGSSIEDPNNYLKSISYSYARDYNTSYYGSINPQGSWNWPLFDPIVINQGFGSHGFAKAFYPEGRHNGIDMDSDSSTQVKAVKSGKLYAGSYQCGGSYPGTLLYAKVDQGDGISSWYLHMTPQ